MLARISAELIMKNHVSRTFYQDASKFRKSPSSQIQECVEIEMLIVDVSSEHVKHVGPETDNLICIMHLYTLTAVSNLKGEILQGLFRNVF